MEVIFFSFSVFTIAHTYFMEPRTVALKVSFWKPEINQIKCCDPYFLTMKKRK